MVLEQLEMGSDADRFVRQLYDWNQYAAAYSAAEGRYRGAIQVTEEMEIILLAMLAERRWDLITATRRRVVDALSLFPTEMANRFLEAASLAEVFSIIDEIETAEEFFLSWKELFTRSTRTNIVNNAELEQIRVPDSVVGWTCANVLKRLTVEDHQQAILRSFLKDADRTVCWRIVHVMGAFPGEANAEQLFAVFDSDSYHWIRYGAIRSLVEIAALANARLRSKIFSKLANNIDKLASDERILDEFERVIFIDKARAPRHWTRDVNRVLKALLNQTPHVEGRAHWERLAYRLYQEYES
ncbi:hypothetical protein [Candidatus Entotheonella palauensis]|uniref:hypothetical protein n=1 Tax=Candidatus Entotheonella palauensis TaxID=93172 RepID=UPI0004AF211B|nr:hypothetical protein [Candidatus Entotheonella palauensis]